MNESLYAVFAAFLPHLTSHPVTAVFTCWMPQCLIVNCASLTVCIVLMAPLVQLHLQQHQEAKSGTSRWQKAYAELSEVK